MPEFDLDKIAERHRQIGKVLLQDWDPIGVAGFPGAQDEYCRYVRGAYNVAMKTRSAHAVAEFLSDAEKTSMGMVGRPLRQLLPAAQKIVDLTTNLYDPSVA